MTDDLKQAVLAIWAAERFAGAASGGAGGEAVELFNRGRCHSRRCWQLRALGKPRPNAVKFFSSTELITLLADRDWLDETTKTIGQYWQRKSARRHQVNPDSQTHL